MKVFFSVIVILAFIGFSCSPSKKNAESIPTPSSQVFNISTSNQSSPILVDGDLSDWNTNLAYKDSYSTLSSMVTANSSNLYIALLVNQEWLQMKILKMGMEIYFDTSGAQNQNEYIEYPIMLQTDGSLAGPANGNQQSIRTKFDRPRYYSSINRLKSHP